MTDQPPVKTPTPEEIKELIRLWKERTGKRYKHLLEAESYNSDIESDWYWNPTETSYVSNTGEVPEKKDLSALYILMFVGTLSQLPKETGIVTWEGLASGLKEGNISVAEWKIGMQKLITERQEVATLLARGGENFVTQADWKFTESQIDNQFKYLDGFANDITNNPNKWLNGRLDQRMGLYREAGYGSLQENFRQQAKDSGMDEERRVLGVADHCNGCLEQASLGWQKIGTLDPIGAEECSSNCRCEFEYRKAGASE